MNYLHFGGDPKVAMALARKAVKPSEPACSFIARAHALGFGHGGVLLDVNDVDIQRRGYPSAALLPGEQRISPIGMSYFGLGLYITGEFMPSIGQEDFRRVVEDYLLFSSGDKQRQAQAATALLAEFNAFVSDLLGSDFSARCTKHSCVPVPKLREDGQTKIITNGALLQAEIGMTAMLQIIGELCRVPFTGGVSVIVTGDGVARLNGDLVTLENVPRNSDLYTLGVSMAYDGLTVAIHED